MFSLFLSYILREVLVSQSPSPLPNQPLIQLTTNCNHWIGDMSAFSPLSFQKYWRVEKNPFSAYFVIVPVCIIYRCNYHHQNYFLINCLHIFCWWNQVHAHFYTCKPLIKQTLNVFEICLQFNNWKKTVFYARNLNSIFSIILWVFGWMEHLFCGVCVCGL